MSRSRIAAAAAASALLAACASTPVDAPPPAEAPATPPPKPPAVSVAPIVPPPSATPAPPMAVPEPPAAVRALLFFSQLRQRPQRDLRQEQDRLRKTFAASRSEHDRIRLALAFIVPVASAAEESQALELLEPLVRDSRSEYHDLASLLAALLTEQRRHHEQAVGLQHKLDRIKALEREMQERSSARDARPR
jgi:hypothetical protein